MDTSSNNKEKKMIHASVLTILALLIFSTLTVAMYLPFSESYHGDNDFSGYFSTHGFGSDLGHYASRVLTLERYLGVTSVNYYITNDDSTFIKTNLPNISGQKQLQDYKDDSLHYFTIVFTEEQFPQLVEGTTEVDIIAFSNNLYSFEEDDIDYHGLEYTFLVPHDFDTHKDIFTLNMISHHFLNNQLFTIMLIGLISIFILIIIAVAIPYSYYDRVSMHRIYNKLFLEFKASIWLGILFILLIVSYNIAYLALDLWDLLYPPGINFFLIAVSIVYLIHMLIYLTIGYLKYVNEKGIYEGFILNSLFIRMSVTVFSRTKRTIVTTFSKIKRMITRIFELDIRDDYNRVLLKIVGANLAILWLISLSWFSGIIIAVLYSVFLFNYLTEFLEKIKKLHVASEKIAVGNFDITIDEEEMDVLKPICENLNNIKEGFELAINEEIKSQKLKTDLITNVSHDLKTPLTSIITYVDLLKEEDSPEKRQEYLEIIDRKSKRLNILIEDLFEASKASSGNIDLQYENVDVIALFRQTMGELQDKIDESELTFRVNLPDEKIICVLDGKRTYRIFENIICNILKYSLKNSRVYIDVQGEDTGVSFTFKNISSYEMNFNPAEMAERFSRGDESRNTEGSGLGLAIAKDLTELQKGRMEISIDGDLFKLTLFFLKQRDN